MADTCSPGEGTTLALEPHLIAPMHPGSPPAGKTVLNVGCGYPLRQRLHRHFHGPEWREIRPHLDPAVQPHIGCSITGMRPVAPGSVDAIRSSHNPPHPPPSQVPLALAAFRPRP